MSPQDPQEKLNVVPVQLLTRQEEFTLTDIAKVLLRNARIFSIIIVIGTVLGIIAALLITPKYDYITAIQIGTYTNTDGTHEIETPEKTRVLLDSLIIPSIVRSFKKEDKNEVYLVDAVLDSGLLMLKSKIKPSSENDYKLLHYSIINKLSIQHERIAQTLRTAKPQNSATATTRTQATNKTRAVSDGALSVKPTSIPRTTIVIIATILSLVTAILVIIIIELKRATTANQG